MNTQRPTSMFQEGTYRCPRCGEPLKEQDEPGAIFWHCAPCNGLAMTLPVLRRLVAEETVTELVHQVRTAPRSAHKDCPSCDQPMVEVDLPLPQSPVALDVCQTCWLIWFDAHELDALPHPSIEDPTGQRPANCKPADPLANHGASPTRPGRLQRSVANVELSRLIQRAWEEGRLKIALGSYLRRDR